MQIRLICDGKMMAAAIFGASLKLVGSCVCSIIVCVCIFFYTCATEEDVHDKTDGQQAKALQAPLRKIQVASV